MDPNEHLLKLARLAIAAFTVWLMLAVFAVAFVTSGNSEKAGHFGDFFGAFNCLLSSFAVAGAIYAVVLQVEELRDARTERQTAETDKKTAEASEILRRDIAAKSGIAQAQGIMLAEFRNLDASLKTRQALITALIEKHKNLPRRIKDLSNAHHITTPAYRGEAKAAEEEFLRAGFPNQKLNVAGDLTIDLLLATEITSYLSLARAEAKSIEDTRLSNFDEITKAEKSLKTIIADLERSILLSPSGPGHPPASPSSEFQ